MRPAVTISGNEISGSDDQFSYAGTLRCDEKQRLYGEIHVKRHTPGPTSLYTGMDDYVLSVSGTVSGSTFEGGMAVKGYPASQLTLEGKRAEAD